MITTYQIRNVLRIYGNQLKKRTILSQESEVPRRQPIDTISISGEARKKEGVLNLVSNSIITQIAGSSGFQTE